MVAEASVHELTIQNIEEAVDERQLKEESNLITMDETPKIPISMPATSLPPFPSMLTTSPLLFPLGSHPISILGSSTLMGGQESELPLENLYGIGSMLA